MKLKYGLKGKKNHDTGILYGILEGSTARTVHTNGPLCNFSHY